MQYRNICTSCVPRILMTTVKRTTLVNHFQCFTAICCSRQQIPMSQNLRRRIVFLQLHSHNEMLYCEFTTQKLTHEAKIQSSGKVMATVVLDCEDVIYTKFMSKATTVTDDSYCKTVWNSIKAIKELSHENLNNTIVLLYDNARLHTVQNHKCCSRK